MLKETSKIEPTQTRGEQIYQYLRDAILTNVIKPREIIYEKDVAAEFQSSITPVREAIKRLASEGFIKTAPYRPAIVAEASYDKYQKICEALFVLDCHASRNLILDLTDEHIQELERMTHEMAALCSVDTVVDYIELNGQIHFYLWKLLRNDFLRDMMFQALDTLKHSFLHMIYSQGNLSSSYLKKSQKVHENLLEILKNKNTSRLRGVIKSHWRITQNGYFK